MIEAVELVRERLLRATAALGNAGVPYAVAGGNAVAVWVARVDRAAVRNTQDVDILLRRADFDRAREALVEAGFVHAQILGIEVFLDGPDAHPRDAVHILFAGEKVRPDYSAAAPDVLDVEKDPEFQVLALDSLVRMKLTSYRFKDRTHLLDMIEVGLIDATWPARFPPPLDARLQELIDNPES
jgi:hypothetical protein